MTGRKVTEHSRELSRFMLQQTVGQDSGLYSHAGEPVEADPPFETEPSTPGYDRQTIERDENPTFDLTGYEGALDALFVVNDAGDLLATVPLLDHYQPVRIDPDDESLTVHLWGDP